MIYLNSDQELSASYNLPSKRWKVRRKRIAKEKLIRRIYNEDLLLSDQIHNMEYEELDVPIQRGYVSKYELKEWAKHIHETSVFEEILSKINVYEYHKNNKLERKKKRKKLRKYRYLKFGDPKLIDLKKNQYNLLSERAKLYFHPIDKYHRKARIWVTYYRFSEPQVFEYRISPYYLTKVQRRNIEAEKRTDEIHNYLVVKKNFTKTEKTRRKYHCFFKEEWDKKPRTANPIKDIPVHELEEIYRQEKELWEYIYNQKN